MRHMSPQSALRRARRELRLVRGEDSRDGQPCWMVYDLHNNGRGIYGDEAKGQDEYQKRLMFRALELIDPEHDWHEYDWHLLSGPAADQERHSSDGKVGSPDRVGDDKSSSLPACDDAMSDEDSRLDLRYGKSAISHS